MWTSRYSTIRSKYFHSDPYRELQAKFDKFEGDLKLLLVPLIQELGRRKIMLHVMNSFSSYMVMMISYMIVLTY